MQEIKAILPLKRIEMFNFLCQDRNYSNIAQRKKEILSDGTFF